MKPATDLSFLAGGGEMAERIRSFDWSKTPLGRSDGWSAALRTTVGLMMANRFPMLLWWGPDYISLYNDAYIPILSRKHPRALGLPVRECWSEIWDILKPLIDTPFNGGPSTWIEDFELYVQRSGFTEESHFIVAYSPVPDSTAPSGIGGVLATVHEISEKVVAERRVTILRDLAVEAAENSIEETCRVATQALARCSKDIPFALLYLVDPDGQHARLAGAAGTEPGKGVSPAVVSLEPVGGGEGWPLGAAYRAQGVVEVIDLASRFDAVPAGPWAEPPKTAVVVPLRSSKGDEPFGLLVGGISSRLKFDEQYKSFCELAANAIATALVKVRAYEAERKRAEALAEIDRAKTLFFSNVSHEFRTPLTLMLGPLEDTLNSADLPSQHREKLDAAHRNSLRLLKLVNSLLDFSRIESGRTQATYEALELAALTIDLASNFRSACERAGLRLVIDCEPSEEPVYVDRDMWEKIVLNLISNAFKFTFEGEISVGLRTVDGQVQLYVRDTGVGIPAGELPRLFERFHRIEGQMSRTYEGSGIGLALVQELVKLHGGTIRADSAVGHGTTFTVTIPLGRSHLPQERIGTERHVSSTAVRADAFVEEALRWLPDSVSPINGALAEGEVPRAVPAQLHGARILVADDNSDMRAYVRRLLGSHCEVQMVADGQAAIEAIRAQPPDLVLADVMMPRLDGFGLVRAIRGDPALADLPVVLLSARAGEEAKIEGFAAGADDYLIKPFSSRELIARVASNLSLAELRKQVAADLRDMNRLHEVANLCVRAENQFQESLEAILQAAIAITGADKGNIQLFEPDSGCLKIAAQSGFEKPFLDFFAEVRLQEPAVSARVLQSGDRVVVEDVTQSEGFAGRPFLDQLRNAGVRAIQSTPLVSSTGKTLGVLSTHFAKPHRPTERQFRVIDLLARQAADYLERKQIEQEQVQAENTRQLLLGELNHRVKNTLASVQAIAQQTIRSAKDPADFANRFSGRIQSLARVHSLLTESTWQGADLRELIRDQLLRGSIDEARLTAWGPAVLLEPQMAVHLAVMLHELGTNSVKYGALSAAKGWVTVNWSVMGDVLHLQWIERGGPIVSVPAKRGFGTTLIEQSAKSEGGSAEQLFEPQGITWKISMKLPHSDARQESVREQPELVVPTPMQQDAGVSPKRAAKLAGLRVLVIEDESLIALDLVDRLEGAGAEVAPPVSTAQESLQVIEDGKFDCALLDANLHGHPVTDIAAALTRRKIPFAFITGYGRAGLPDSFKQAPVLSKPVSDEQLFAAIIGIVSRPRKVVPLKS
jgi:signal transduction histidine kinase/CheY-like chemotaxis protein